MKVKQQFRIMKKPEFTPINDVDIIGTWQMNYDDDDLEEYEYIQFRKDGTAIMSEISEDNDTFIVHCSWERDGDVLVIREIDNSEITGKFIVIAFSEDSLTLKIEEDDYDASTIVLKRVPDGRVNNSL